MSEGLICLTDDISYSKTGDIVSDAQEIIESSQRIAHREVNAALVYRNWLIGRRIDEEDFRGSTRSERYGKEIVEKLSAELTKLYGKGFSKVVLWRCVRFYRAFPDIVSSAMTQSQLLTWTHYQALLKEQDDEARAWYAKEAYEQSWSVRTLQRNISTQYYHRLLSIQAKDMLALTTGDQTQEPGDETLEFIKNPVIAEFLGFATRPSVHETELEAAIIANLQQFLLELGKGYAFIARQQHIRTETGSYFIDLVFYNVILKCYVLIDLKEGEITHQDVGQMDMYVRMYDELKRRDDDRPTIGIVLCSETNDDIARYSMLHGSEQLFASEYRLYLPTEEQLKREIEVQKEIFRQQREGLLDPEIGEDE